MAVVYAIRNTVNDKIYIGSSIDFGVRLRMHKHQLRKNKHHSILLQRAWNKYGAQSFSIEPIEYVTNEEVLEREQVWLNFFKPEYNISTTASAPMTGKKHSLATREKYSLDRNGKKQPERTDSYRKNMSIAKGKAVQRIDFIGNVLEEFTSTKEAATAMGVSPEAIQAAIRNQYRSGKNWWKYKDAEYTPIKKRISFR